MKQNWLWRIGMATALAAILFLTLPVWSQTPTGERSGRPRDYQTPDGRRVACTNKGPLERYKAAQEKEISKLTGQKNRRLAGLDNARKEEQDAKTRYDRAKAEVDRLDTQIRGKEDELRQAQEATPRRPENERRLKNELDRLKRSRTEAAGRLPHGLNSARKELDNKIKKREDIERQIRDIDADLAKYKDRIQTANKSHTQGCGCEAGFELNQAGECIDCRPQPGNPFPCGMGQRR